VCLPVFPMNAPLDSQLLKRAYLHGFFPMDHWGELYWHCPEERGLLPIGGMRVSRSLAKALRRQPFLLTFDQAFREVMEGCMDREDTWMTSEMVEAYCQCHHEGWGHSCEAWRNGELVGGVYGLAIGGVFCGESMFSRESNASKAALKGLIDQCRSLGFEVFDCQILNPHTESLGGYTIPKKEYLASLKRLAQKTTPWSWNP
jgi:leucyl/phenylalanyl-tRNA---protein transferase